MERVRRFFGCLAVVALAGSGLWLVSSPAEAVQDTILVESDVLYSGAVLERATGEETDGSLDILFAKPIKDPNCRKPCKPFVKTKSGLVCVFVGCFEQSGECAYRC